jgi:hypothetical protein
MEPGLDLKVEWSDSFNGEKDSSQPPLIEKAIFFRAKPDIAEGLEIGQQVSFSLAWRIRGFRAIDVQI